MQMIEYKFPRRHDLQQLTPTELEIRRVLRMVGALGAHPYLTDAETLLIAAMERVANFVELDPPADSNVTSVVVEFEGVECKVVMEERDLHEDAARAFALQEGCRFVRLEPGYTPKIPFYRNL